MISHSRVSYVNFPNPGNSLNSFHRLCACQHWYDIPVLYVCIKVYLFLDLLEDSDMTNDHLGRYKILFCVLMLTACLDDGIGVWLK